MVSQRGSGNSHVAIMARALDIPTVMGALDLPLFGVDGRPLILDGFLGQVFVNPSTHVRQPLSGPDGGRAGVRRGTRRAAEMLPCVTRDGRRVQLWVNIGLIGEVSRSLDRGAEGIGLFRTELPFMTLDRFPTEEEQRVIYSEHMEAFRRTR